ncbi:MAG: FAD-dependent oxidoreductase [Thermogemmata sp.]|nr:FAD-dependent oxidoreductase [Thermogemmata sp.]
MNRRAFLSAWAVTPLVRWLPAFGQPGERNARELRGDIAIIGAGVGGIACALAAARRGLRVLLTEQYDWIGGQLTAQAVPPDEHRWIEEHGSTHTYRQFRTQVRDYYRRHYPLQAAAAKYERLNPGQGTVSRLCHEPRVALAVLLQMLAPYLAAGRITLIQPFQPRRVETDGDRVRAVEGMTRLRDRLVLQAPYIIDATETGELLPLARVEYVTGAESQRETRELHAPLDAQPHNHQACTVCFALDYEPGTDHRIEEPPNYRFWRDYVPMLTPPWPGKLLSWNMSDPRTLKPRAVTFDPTGAGAKGALNLWIYRRILFAGHFTPASGIRDITLVNWPQNDYWLGNLYDVPPADAQRHLMEAYQLSLALVYWLQTEAPRPDGGQGWRGLRVRPDVVGTEHGLAMAPYIRESRRIRAVFTVSEQHVGVEARSRLLGKKPGEFTAEKFPDSVGTGCYRIDLHPSTGGNNYIDVSALPFQIPLGALIPIRVENLLPACKNIGTTHITNGCYRLHPVEWSIGEAVGELVAFCLDRKRLPRQVRKDPQLLQDLQKQLSDAGVDLDWPDAIASQIV